MREELHTRSLLIALVCAFPISYAFFQVNPIPDLSRPRVAALCQKIRGRSIEKN
jgi:hypothetical protein